MEAGSIATSNRPREQPCATADVPDPVSKREPYASLYAPHPRDIVRPVDPVLFVSDV